MKIVIAGGSGYLGNLLSQHFNKNPNYEIVILSRTHQLNKKNIFYVHWNGKTKGAWTAYLENSDVLINLAGKSVNCRYTKANKEKIYNSRLESTSILCQVVQELKKPPNVFIQSSSATIYRHSEDMLMTEKNGEIGVDFSMDVCEKWESVFNVSRLPKTKKIITRTSIVMGNSGGAFPIIKRLTNVGLGGKQGSGKQYISWISEEDYVRSIDYLIQQNAGIYNVCAPTPLRNNIFQKKLRQKLNAIIGLPTPKWMLQIGSFLIRTEEELLLKSRKVYPEKLIQSGFTFTSETIDDFFKTI